jgi:hypothetical protein
MHSWRMFIGPCGITPWCRARWLVDDETSRAFKQVHPFTTYAMSGPGHVIEEYTAACRGARIGEALAIRGEEAERSRPKVEAWLRRLGLPA